jgi:hypothetical protein
MRGSVAVSASNFRKSSFSGLNGCVEVAILPSGQVALRDSKDTALEARVFTPIEWTAFIAGVKAGEFDLGTLND